MDLDSNEISISKITSLDIESVKLSRQVYETEEQFLDRVVFYLCCIDMGIEHEKAEMLCNVYRNKSKYKVIYPEQIEEQINKIIQKYKISTSK